MNDFLVSLEKASDSSFHALFASGVSVELAASNYADAVCEADQLTFEDLVE
jgi:hypothetical protein